MKLLVAYNTPVYICDDNNLLQEEAYYQHNFLDKGSFLPSENLFTLEGNVLAKGDENNIFSLLELPRKSNLIKSDSITVVCDDRKKLIKLLKKNYKVIKSVGGVISKDNNILLIKKMAKWDLPKGMINKREKKKHAALREVREECNVIASIIKKLGSVWYFYRKNNKASVLKKVTWYCMECLDDKKMKPQVKEGIERVEWVDIDNIHHLYNDMYLSIKYVINKFLKQEK
jgi:ADP-ribose pyrophosphatase YjhB (NUDIX family)